MHKLFLVTQKYLDTHCVRKTKEKRKKIVRDLFDEAVKLRSGQRLPRAPQTEHVFPSHPSTPEPSEGVPESQHIEVETPRPEKERTESFGHIAGSFLTLYLNSPGATDTVFGIYRDKDGNFKIGDSQIEIQKDDLYIKDRHFKGTRGLWELLTKKSVDHSKITSSDKHDYKQILVLTNGHLRNNGPLNRIKSSRSKKYREIIAKLFPSKTVEAKHRQRWVSYDA
jgi:hypothetical protein